MNEHLRNLAIAASSSAPFVGGPLAFLLDKYLPSELEQRRGALLEQIEADMREVEELLTPERLSSSEFISVFLKAVRLAIEEHQQEKLDAYRAVILNNLLNQPAEFDEVALFLRLISELTLDQIRILQLLHSRALEQRAGSGLLPIMEEEWPDVDRDYLIACTTELLRYNVISSNPSNPQVREGAKNNNALTSLGERFIDYITVPGSTRKGLDDQIVG